MKNAGPQLSYMKNLLIKHPMVSLMAPHLKRFFAFFCLATKDLYNEGALGGDGSEYQTRCNLRICLIGLVKCEDSPIKIIKIKHIC